MVRQPRDPRVAIHTDARRGIVKCYGKEFKFIASRVETATPKQCQESYNLAHADAQLWGQEVLAAMEKRLGRALTRREQVFGQEVVPEEKVSGSLVEHNSDTNPHTRLVSFYSSRFFRSEQDKRRNQELLDLAIKRQAVWEANKIHSERLAAVDGDPEIQRARAHAEQHAFKLKIDGTSEQIREHEARTKLVNSIDASAGRYFQSLKPAVIPTDALPVTRTMLEPLLDD